MNLPKYLKTFLFAIVCGCLFASCSYFTGDSDEIEVEPVECTEDPIDINLKIVDKRWCREGGYGVARVSVYLKKDLALLLKEPALAALEKQNLYYSDCGVPVEFEIEQFFCDVLEHRCTWNCVSELIFNVKVTDCNDRVYYSRRIDGIAENDFEMTERNGKARKALETALDDAMDSLFNDLAFRRAVKKAASICFPEEIQ